MVIRRWLRHVLDVWAKASLGNSRHPRSDAGFPSGDLIGRYKAELPSPDTHLLDNEHVAVLGLAIDDSFDPSLPLDQLYVGVSGYLGDTLDLCWRHWPRVVPMLPKNMPNRITPEGDTDGLLYRRATSGCHNLDFGQNADQLTANGRSEALSSIFPQQNPLTPERKESTFTVHAFICCT